MMSTDENVSNGKCLRESTQMPACDAVGWIRRFVLCAGSRFLEIDFGDRRRLRIGLNTTVVVGRGPGADVCIPEDALMSRRHFSISYQTGQIRLVDLLSTNGTWVNGVNVQSRLLNPTDTIVAGTTQFKLKSRPR